MGFVVIAERARSLMGKAGHARSLGDARAVWSVDGEKVGWGRLSNNQRIHQGIRIPKKLHIYLWLYGQADPW